MMNRKGVKEDQEEGEAEGQGIMILVRYVKGIVFVVVMFKPLTLATERRWDRQGLQAKTSN